MRHPSIATPNFHRSGDIIRTPRRRRNSPTPTPRNAMLGCAAFSLGIRSSNRIRTTVIIRKSTAIRTRNIAPSKPAFRNLRLVRHILCSSHAACSLLTTPLLPAAVEPKPCQTANNRRGADSHTRTYSRLGRLGQSAVCICYFRPGRSRDRCPGAKQSPASTRARLADRATPSSSGTGDFPCTAPMRW